MTVVGHLPTHTPIERKRKGTRDRQRERARAEQAELSLLGAAHAQRLFYHTAANRDQHRDGRRIHIISKDRR